jgi:hypothetical protein
MRIDRFRGGKFCRRSLNVALYRLLRSVRVQVNVDRAKLTVSARTAEA